MLAPAGGLDTKHATTASPFAATTGVNGPLDVRGLGTSRGECVAPTAAHLATASTIAAFVSPSASGVANPASSAQSLAASQVQPSVTQQVRTGLSDTFTQPSAPPLDLQSVERLLAALKQSGTTLSQPLPTTTPGTVKHVTWPSTANADTRGAAAPMETNAGVSALDSAVASARARMARAASAGPSGGSAERAAVYRDEEDGDPDEVGSDDERDGHEDAGEDDIVVMLESLQRLENKIDALAAALSVVIRCLTGQTRSSVMSNPVSSISATSQAPVPQQL